MREPVRLIALDLDGTLLNSSKQLSGSDRAALARAAEKGTAIVPTTGRFYDAMPQAIRELPFIRYAITINGAQAVDLQTGEIIYKAEIPLAQALEVMELLDTLPVLYDCYMGNKAFMNKDFWGKIDSLVSDPHYRKMVRELRQPVDDLRDYIRAQGMDVQKVQFFTDRPALRLEMLEGLSRRFEGLIASSSVIDNVEINQARANKGEAMLALAAHLGIPPAATMAFGDGLNDLSMLRAAGIGVAMANGCQEARDAADWVTRSCDESGVAHGIERFCFH